MNGMLLPSAITPPIPVVLAKLVRHLGVLALLMTPSVDAAYANVVTDWDETAMEVIQGNAPAPPPQIGPIGGLRIATIIHLAIFQAVNSIASLVSTIGGTGRNCVELVIANGRIVANCSP